MLVLLLAASATAGTAGEWQAYGLLVPQLNERVSPATGDRRDWRFLGIAPAGSQRYVLLVQEMRTQLSPWADEKALAEEKQKNLFVAREHLKKQGSRIFLAVFNQQGKLAAAGAAQEQARGQVGAFPNSWSIPLVMEQASRCNYAFLDAPTARLFCYDLQLAFQTKLELPLHEVGRPMLLAERDKYSIVFFGRRFSKAPPLEKPENLSGLKPEVPESLGCLWVVGEKQARPFPLSVEEVFLAVAKLARDPEGNRVTVHKASLSLIPVETLDPGNTGEVVVEAVAASTYESYVDFRGWRLFFHARLAATGLGTVSQLPFWVSQEAREEPELDTKRGIVRLPSFAKANVLRAFQLRARRIGLYLEAAYKTPRPDGSFDPRVWDLGKYFVTFSGNTLAQLDDLDEEVLDSVAEALTTRDLSVHPVNLQAMVAPNRFAFGTICRERQGQEQTRHPCFALVELGD